MLIQNTKAILVEFKSNVVALKGLLQHIAFHSMYGSCSLANGIHQEYE